MRREYLKKGRHEGQGGSSVNSPPQTLHNNASQNENDEEGKTASNNG